MDSVLTQQASNLKYCIPLLIVTSYLVQWYLSYRRLAHFPGPQLAGWSSLWLVSALATKQSHLEFYELAKKYGSLVRVQPNVLLTTDVELIKRMSSPRTAYRKSDWYIAFQLVPGIDNIFSMRNNKLHASRKAQLSNGYLGRDNIALEPSIDRNILTFVDLIRKKYISSATELRAMDLAEKAQFFTLDVGMDLATGIPLGDLEQDKDLYDYIAINSATMGAAIVIGSVPAIASFLRLPFISRRIFPNAKDKVGFGKLIGLTQEQVAERFSPRSKGEEKADMLTSFKRSGLSQQDVISESLTQVIAGSDTTANTIRTLMVRIITSPHVYSRLNEEIDSAVRNGKISSPLIRLEEARALPYLQACIKEGLRIFPAGTGLLSKQVPPEGDTINGMHLPGGTEIGINIWAVTRNTEVFGPDAKAFRPERWLEASPEQYAKMERVQELVWGNGKFVCLGRTIALIELNKIFVELLRNFEWSLLDPTTPWKSACYGVFFMSEMWVRITEKKRMS